MPQFGKLLRLSAVLSGHSSVFILLRLLKLVLNLQAVFELLYKISLQEKVSVEIRKSRAASPADFRFLCLNVQSRLHRARGPIQVRTKLLL